MSESKSETEIVPPPARAAFRLVVTGGRDFDDYGMMCRKLNQLLVEKSKTHEIVIVSGGARGADALAETYARARGYRLEVFSADWQRHGRAAGPKRNAWMAAAGHALAAFWDGNSQETWDLIQRAEDKKIPVRIVLYPFKERRGRLN